MFMIILAKHNVNKYSWNQHILEIYIKVSYNINSYEKYGRKEN